MGRKLLKIVQTITTFRNPLADPMGTVADPLWSADPSLKTAAQESTFPLVKHCDSKFVTDQIAKLHVNTQMLDKVPQLNT